MAAPLIIRDDQLESLSDAAGGQRAIAACDESTWVEIRLVDQSGQPVVGEPYRLRLPDWSIRDGVLDGSGRARYEGITAGTCSVSFPGFDAKEWRPV